MVPNYNKKILALAYENALRSKTSRKLLYPEGMEALIRDFTFVLIRFLILRFPVVARTFYAYNFIRKSKTLKDLKMHFFNLFLLFEFRLYPESLKY